jgi:dihydrofolate reductase
LEWKNSTLIKGDLAGEVAALKEQPGKDILVFGSADLVNTLTQLDLVDEYRLMVFPVVVGKGKRLFEEGLGTKSLRLADSKTFDSGAVVLTYSPVETEG